MIKNVLKNVFSVFFFFFIILFFLIISNSTVVPSASMEPTLIRNDFLLTNPLAYGLKIPFTNQIFFQTSPKRGDVVIFENDNKTFYVERIVGIPGDRVNYSRNSFVVNGELAKLTDYTAKNTISIYNEELLGKKHKVQYDESIPFNYKVDVLVPDNTYFVLGDNRDNSFDSRQLGFIPRESIVKKVPIILFNSDCFYHRGNCDRFFKHVN